MEYWDTPRELEGFKQCHFFAGIVDSEEQVRRIHRCAAEIAGGMMSMFPLCKTVPGRTGLLRGAGNAIVPEVGAEFITSYLETEGKD